MAAPIVLDASGLHAPVPSHGNVLPGLVESLRVRPRRVGRAEGTRFGPERRAGAFHTPTHVGGRIPGKTYHVYWFEVDFNIRYQVVFDPKKLLLPEDQGTGHGESWPFSSPLEGFPVVVVVVVVGVIVVLGLVVEVDVGVMTTDLVTCDEVVPVAADTRALKPEALMVPRPVLVL
jgi:hypothetical protein